MAKIQHHKKTEKLFLADDGRFCAKRLSTTMTSMFMISVAMGVIASELLSLPEDSSWVAIFCFIFFGFVIVMNEFRKTARTHKRQLEAMFGDIHPPEPNEKNGGVIRSAICYEDDCLFSPLKTRIICSIKKGESNELIEYIVYGSLIRYMPGDQVTFIENPSHQDELIIKKARFFIRGTVIILAG